MTFEELPPITPVNFFQLSLSCPYLDPKKGFPSLEEKGMKAYLLPDMSGLCDEESFADVAMGWHREGLEFLFKVNKPYEETFYPGVERGDSVEIFIDTRDVKTSGYNTRFCHHFFFLPDAVDGRQMGEMTHFRTEDRHELCSPDDLQIKTHMRRSEYLIHCGIPKECLVGYDPEQFDRVGFTYRVNRPYWASQHFSVVTEDYQLEQQPSLWSSIRLER